MSRQFSYKPYRRPFVRSLQTAHGEWSVREGFIVRVEENGRVGYGEVAPIPWFGTETLEEARAFLERLVDDAALAEDTNLLKALPCCAFGVSAAVVDSGEWGVDGGQCDFESAGLLPAGDRALEVLAAKQAGTATERRGYKDVAAPLCRGEVFKWKIGVASVADELAIFEKLVAALPARGKLRLDANAGLSSEDLESWLEVLQLHEGCVEYLEQPLAVGLETEMAEAMGRTGVPIALDESLSGADATKWFAPGAWKGPLVVKPLLMGDVRDLVEKLRPVQEQVVLSSVFETAIGRRNALRVLGALPRIRYAAGFDTANALQGHAPACPPNAANGNESGHAGACPSIEGVSEVGLRGRVDLCKIDLSNLEASRGILLAESDPIEFAVTFFAAMQLEIPIILANPNWGELEWDELRQLVSPARRFGVAFSSGAVEVPDLPRGAILIPTGGSTGGVKLAMHSWESLVAAARGLQTFLGGGPIDSCCLLPLYHVSGLMQLVRASVTGGTVRFDDAEVVGSCLSWVPTQLQRALDAGDRLDDFCQARAIFVGGAAMSDVLAERARSAKLPIVPVYGMTETAAMVAAQSAAAFASGVVGAEPLPHVQLEIVDPDAEGVGRIRVRGASLFRGYWGRASVDLSEGYLTDDEGFFGAEGLLQVVGRVDRLINTGGEKVDPREVEAALLQVVGVQEALVAAEPDSEWGQRVVAYCVVRDDSVTELSIQSALGLTPYKKPKCIRVVEKLPLDAKGKFVK